MLSANPVIYELGWQLVTERRVTAPLVAELLDVVEQVGLRLVPRGVMGAMHPLVFQAVEEAVRRRLEPALNLSPI